MRRRHGGDASFVFGLMLGLFVGAAIVLVLASDEIEKNIPALSGKAEGAKKQLEEKKGEAEDRLAGASEGATP